MVHGPGPKSRAATMKGAQHEGTTQRLHVHIATWHCQLAEEDMNTEGDSVDIALAERIETPACIINACIPIHMVDEINAILKRPWTEDERRRYRAIGEPEVRGLKNLKAEIIAQWSAAGWCVEESYDEKYVRFSPPKVVARRDWHVTIRAVRAVSNVIAAGIGYVTMAYYAFVFLNWLRR